MEKELILSALRDARSTSKKKFAQRFEFIINLKDVDIKKIESQLNMYVSLPHPVKKIKVCGLCAPELFERAREVCDKVILAEEFERYTKKDIKKLAKEYDYFIAQGNVMVKVASVFGRILGPRGKMPNPKAGCVLQPTSNIKQIYDKLQNTINIKVKNSSCIQFAIGNEGMKDDEIVENILMAYNSVLSALPNERDNIKNCIIKLTMGKPIILNEKREVLAKVV